MNSQVFIMQNISGLSKRVLRRIGSQKNNNTQGFIVDYTTWSFKLNCWRKPKTKKFDFFGDALKFTNYEVK